MDACNSLGTQHTWHYMRVVPLQILPPQDCQGIFGLLPLRRLPLACGPNLQLGLRRKPSLHPCSAPIAQKSVRVVSPGFGGPATDRARLQVQQHNLRIASRSSEIQTFLATSGDETQNPHLYSPTFALTSIIALPLPLYTFTLFHAGAGASCSLHMLMV